MTEKTQAELLAEIETLKDWLAEQKSPETLPAENFANYAVKPGDSLSKIAKQAYGDGNEWPRIYERNKALIGDNPDLIHPGQKLVIPLLEG